MNYAFGLACIHQWVLQHPPHPYFLQVWTWLRSADIMLFYIWEVMIKLKVKFVHILSCSSAWRLWTLWVMRISGLMHVDCCPCSSSWGSCAEDIHSVWDHPLLDIIPNYLGSQATSCQHEQAWDLHWEIQKWCQTTQHHFYSAWVRKEGICHLLYCIKEY